MAERADPGHVLDLACDHCGLPVPDALRVDGAERQFCCSGCRTVFEASHEPLRIPGTSQAAFGAKAVEDRQPRFVWMSTQKGLSIAAAWAYARAMLRNLDRRRMRKQLGQAD